jgi:hypothetical protein
LDVGFGTSLGFILVGFNNCNISVFQLGRALPKTVKIRVYTDTTARAEVGSVRGNTMHTLKGPTGTRQNSFKDGELEKLFVFLKFVEQLQCNSPVNAVLHTFAVPEIVCPTVLYAVVTVD